MLLLSQRWRGQRPPACHGYAEQAEAILNAGAGHRSNIGITGTSA